MASWYSKILTTTTSQISNLQSRLLQSENDGDTEDDTHVCRVLRAYYTEEGKPFPGWLPPDPKAPPPAAATYSQPQVGSRYGRLSPQQTGASTGPAATGLSSLWDSSGRAAGAGAGQQQPQGRPGQFSRGGGYNDWGRDDAQSRLPSQRGGGYQQNNPFSRDSSNSTPPGSGGSGGVSAQDKLKKRLWGGGGARTTSPSSGTGGPFQPPPGRGGGYSSGNRGGDSGDYESRFAPGGMYDASSNRGGGGDNKPFLAANSPWASNEDEFMGGGRPNRAGGGGLPSGPRRGAGGLPSGPRMR